MKESSVHTIPKEQTPIYNPKNQCYGKKQYKYARRAMKDCQSLAADNPDRVFTVYYCPHCKKYHVGTVRQ